MKEIYIMVGISILMIIAAIAAVSEAQRIRLTFAPILELDPRWTGNITECLPAERLYFDNGRLVCELVQSFPNQSIYMSRNSSNPSILLNYGNWSSVGTLTVGGKTIYIWERIT